MLNQCPEAPVSMTHKKIRGKKKVIQGCLNNFKHSNNLVQLLTWYIHLNLNLNLNNIQT